MLRGAWVAQSAECLTLAQGTILQFVGSRPASGSMRIAQSLEPASDSVSLSVSAPPLLMLCLSLSLSHKNKSTLKQNKQTKNQNQFPLKK